MYKEYFGLKDNPFSITSDPRYVYMSPHHREAFGHLLYGTGEDGGFVQITGEVGTGKTTLICMLLEQNIPDVDVALVSNPRLEVAEFLAGICDELRVPRPQTGASLKQLMDALKAHLLDTRSQGRRTVLIVDEAQYLSREGLEQIRLLTNLETHRHKLLFIVLVGQPELRELLARKDLCQLAQRITVRYHLDNLTPAQTREYVLHRLRAAGGRAEIFTRPALYHVYRLTRGTPRLINAVCDRALLGAYGQGRKQVTRAVLRRAASEVFGKSGSRRSDHGGPVFLPWLVMLAVSVVLGINLYLAWPLFQRQAANTGADAPGGAGEQSPPAIPTAVAKELAGAEPAARPDWLMAEEAAFSRLAGVWGVKGGESIECLDLERRSLLCESGAGNWSRLRGFNLPVLLHMQTGGQPSYVLVRRLDGDEAIVLGQDGESRLPLASLSEGWTGGYRFIWQPQIKTTHIGPNSTRVAMRWLLKRLQMAEGSKDTVVRVPYRYDAVVRERVRRFQERQGLAVDGLVGPQTMIYLNALAPEAGTPVLVN